MICKNDDSIRKSGQSDSLSSPFSFWLKKPHSIRNMLSRTDVFLPQDVACDNSFACPDLPVPEALKPQKRVDLK